jgi:hypothetical protein
VHARHERKFPMPMILGAHNFIRLPRPTYQLGEQDENGIVRLNIDFFICIKYIVLWPNLGKIMKKFRFRATPP